MVTRMLVATDMSPAAAGSEIASNHTKHPMQTREANKSSGVETYAGNNVFRHPV